MKAYIAALSFIFVIAIAFNVKGSAVGADYQIVDRDANSRTWEKTTYEPGPDGQLVPKKHHYVELATGMNYKSNGRWLESKELIVPMTQGGAAAEQGSHKVHFPADIYDGVIEIVTPDGTHLMERPMGISYDDGTNTVLIAQLKNSQGYIVNSNQVIYPDAFDGVGADLLVTYRRAGVECDLVFREQPAMPEQYGMDSKSAKLQLVTEFFDTAEPQKVLGRTSKDEKLKDTVLRFGQMTMVMGRAFAVGENKHDAVPVYKSWVHVENRIFLIEQVPYDQMGGRLKTLPSVSGTVSYGPILNKVSSRRLLPPQRLVKVTTKAMQLASAEKVKKPGVVLDYYILDNTVGNELSYNTYLVTGDVYFDYLTVDSGAVIKYDPDNIGAIVIGAGGGGCGCGTGPSYLSAGCVFTSKDDNSVGDVISGSTGTPGIVPTTGITLYTADISLEGCGYVSFSYLNCGIDIETADPVDLSDYYSGEGLYISNCNIGLYQGGGSSLSLWSGAFNNCHICFDQTGTDAGLGGCGSFAEGCAATVANVSFNNCSYIVSGYYNNGGCGSYVYPGNSFTITVPGYVAGSSDSLFAFFCFDQYGGAPGALELTWNPGNVSCCAPSGSSAYWNGSVDGAGVYAGSAPSSGCPAIVTIPASTVGMVGQNITMFEIQYANGGIAWNGWSGSSSSDMNGNGIPDLWEMQHGIYNLNLSKTGDYSGDGISNYQEYLHGNNPTNFVNSLLAYFPFDNTNTWVGSAGQLPTLKSNLLGVATWSTNGLWMDQTNKSAIRYYVAETNGNANILRCQGTVSFWVKPDWSSTNAGGVGPQSEGRLLEIGTKGGSSGWWALCLGSAGTNIYFCTQTNSTSTLKTNLNAAISWTSNVWRQVVLTYSKTNSSLYIDGSAIVTNGVGVTNYPPISVSGPLGTTTNQLTIGSSASGTNQVRAVIDELNTYNYLINAGTIYTNYQNVIFQKMSILMQPTTQSVTQGSDANFSVTAVGLAPLQYQWYLNANIIPNATNALLALHNVQSFQSGTYCVSISSGAGTIYSSNAILTVITPPVILQQPSGQTLVQGDNVTFSVGTAGAGLAYQWYFNGINISGANGSTFFLSNVQPTNAGNYSVLVSNAAGSVVSANASMKVIGVNRIILDGSQPEIQGSISVNTNSSVALRAVPNPTNTTFIGGYPRWSILSQPPGSSLTAPAAGTNPASFTPLVPGQYVVAAACGSSSNTFTITVVDGSDLNYDGIPDNKELAFGTNLPQTELGSWRFDTPNWIGLEGQSPVFYTNLLLAAGWSVGGVEINSNYGPSQLTYLDVNTNTGVANINCRQGSIRFWFRPDWASSSVGGNGPGNWATLVEVGQYGTTNGCWGLYADPAGNTLYFCTATNAGVVTSVTTNLAIGISWFAGTANTNWHEVAITYSATNSSLYVDGQPAITNGSGVAVWPGSAVRAKGFNIGDSFGGTNWAQGRFDNFETFNYPMSGDLIKGYYLRHSVPPPGRINECDLAPICLYFPFVQTLTNYQEVWVTNNSSSGNFLWLSWSNQNPSDGDIAYEIDNLNSVQCYINPNTLNNEALYIDDLVYGGTGSKSGLDGHLNQYTNSLNSTNPVLIGIVLTSTPISGSGGNGLYQVAAFANIDLISYSLNSNTRYFHFIYRGGRACDQYYPNQPPTNWIVAPNDLQVFSSVSNAAPVIPITDAAFDPEDGLTNIAYYSGVNPNFLTNLIYYQAVTNANTNLYTFTWNSAPDGTNYIMAVATDEFGGCSTSTVVRVIANYVPVVSAGPSQTLIWPDNGTNATLAGVAFDPDGLPFPLVASWAVTSSNGPVFIQNISATTTTAEFVTNGSYTFRLSASDGAVTVNSNCTITILSRPTVSITAPTNNVIYSLGATITLNAVALDSDGVVTNVEFRAGATSLTNIPGETSLYTFNWFNASNGSYSITSIATDNNGLQATSSVLHVTVDAAPTVWAGGNHTILWPVNAVTNIGSMADDGLPSGVTNITWSVISSNGTVTFSNAHSLTNIATFSTNGTYVLQLTCDDGFLASSDTCTITVLRQPFVSVTWPTNNAIFNFGTKITNFAVAYGYSGIVTNVQFYNWNTNFIGTAAVIGTNYILTWTNLPWGTNSLTAVARDGAGLTNVSVPVRIIINNAPIVGAGTNQTIIWPANSITNIASIAEDGLPFGVTNITWNLINSNGTVAFGSTNALTNIVTFSTNGTYVFRLVCDDGFATNSSVVTNFVLQRPYVSIIWPTNNAVFPSGVTITNQAVAYGMTAAVTNVWFFNGTNLLGTAVASGTNYSLAWTNVPLGTNLITAVAVDARGLTNSSLVTVVVRNPLPVVHFVNPTNNQVFVSSPVSIPLTATAVASSGTISSVQFLNGSTVLGNGFVTNGAYYFLWTNVTAGTYTLKAKATDSNNNSAADIINIVVNAKPIISIISPTNIQEFVEVTNVSITAAAFDPDGTITNVAFYSRTNLPFAVSHTGTNYTLVWSNLTAGYYMVTAVATDNLGVQSTSEICVFKVDSTNIPPSIFIAGPTNNAYFQDGADITITATATNGSGTITNVEFFVNGSSIGSVRNSPYTITECCWKTGGYQIMAIATDDRGMSAISAPVNITIAREPLTAGGYWDPLFSQLVETNFHQDFWTDVEGSIVGIIPNGDLLVNGITHNSAYYTPYFWLVSDFPATHISYNDISNSVSGMESVLDPADNASLSGSWSNLKVDGTNIYIVGSDATADDGTCWNRKHDVLTWTGSRWAPVTTNSWFVDFMQTNYYKSPNVTAIEVFDGEIYVAGTFLDATNSQMMLLDTNVQYVARFDKTNNCWVSVATNNLDGCVYALAVMNGHLYAGGGFRSAGGDTNISCVARLDGNKWVGLGSGISTPYNSYPFVTSMSVCGSNLFVGGHFSMAGGNPRTLGVAVWNGVIWNDLNGGPSLNGIPYSDNGTMYFQWFDPFITQFNDQWPYVMQPLPQVFAVKAHGNKLFVGGRFASVQQGGEFQPIAGVHYIVDNGVTNDATVVWTFQNVKTNVAMNIAQATWSEVDHKWIWSDLDTGVSDKVCDGDGTVRGLAIREGKTPGTYDLLAVGGFSVVGSSSMYSHGAALWRVGPLPPSMPSVIITNPPYAMVYTNPDDVLIMATATSNYTNILSVAFYDNGAELTSGVTDNGDGSYSCHLSYPSGGLHSLTALATDGAGLQGQSRPVFIQVIDTNNVSTLNVVDDSYTVLANDSETTFNVLANDSTSTSNQLQILGVYPAMSGEAGSANVNYGETSISYRPSANYYGTEVLLYTVTDGVTTNSANITVKIRTRPDIFIQSPLYGDSVAVSSNVVISGAAIDYDAPITNIMLYANGLLVGQASPINIIYDSAPTNFFFEWDPAAVSPQTCYTFFSFNWSNSVPGFYTFMAKAVDVYGYTNLYTYDPFATLDNYTLPVTISLTNSSTATNVVQATIDNLVDSDNGLGGTIYPVIQDGFFDLTGTAWDSNVGDNVTYEVLVHPTDDSSTVIANVTPQPRDVSGFHSGRVSHGALGTLDFSTVPDGVYDLELVVHGGAGVTNAIVRFQLLSQLKIGQFGFSQQDLNLPVAGIPLTIIRTYNSLNPRSADFGYGWTFALNTMDVSIDEQRMTVAVGGPDAPFDDGDEDVNYGPQKMVSIRLGGGRDVSLTLPDGRRATFAFTPVVSPADFVAHATWTAPPNVHYTLTPLGSDVINLIINTPPYWQAGGANSTFDNYDVPGWILQAPDGTQYYITRGDPDNVIYMDPDEPYHYLDATVYGEPKLTKIVERSGDTIVITDDSIYHQSVGGGADRTISFVRDSKGRITAIYDPNSGTNGLPVLQYVYNNDTGNLIQVLKLMDRNAGNYVTNYYLYDNRVFTHYITGIVNGDGVPLVRNLYDDLGRLIGIIDTNGRTNLFVHDINNRQEIQYDRSGQPTYYTYDTRGNVISTMDALGHTNGFTYDANGYLTNSADALGHITSFVRDADGNALSVTLPYPAGADPAAYTTRSTYDAYGNQTSVILPTGGAITNSYDPVTGNLTETRDENGHLISSTTYNSVGLPATEGDQFGTNSYAYDLSGNMTSFTNSLGLVTTSGYDANGNLTSLSDKSGNSTVGYDAMNRETTADYGHGITISNSYQSDQDWNSVDAPTIGHMERKFDDQGRLGGWTTANGATPGFAYDVNGRLEYETNSIGVVTHSVYNAVGWLIATTNLATGAGVTYGYDATGKKTSETNAYGQATTYDYWPSGSLMAVTNALGVYWHYSDAAGACSACGSSGSVTDYFGRVVETVTSSHNLPLQAIRRAYPGATGTDAATNSTTYISGMTTPEQEAADYPATVTDEGGRTRLYDYTTLGQLYRATDLSGSVWWTNQYDGDGKLTNVLSPTGDNLSYAYDDLDNVSTIRFGDGNYFTNYYNAQNRLGGMALPSGVVITNFYDFTGRLTNRSSTIGETASFAYNLNDVVTTMTDNTGTTTNLYDAAGRLCGIDYPSGASVRYELDLMSRIAAITNRASVAGSVYVTHYQYDSTGNITNVIDPFNGPTSFVYDQLGRRTQRTLPNGIVTTWQYNWKDQVTNILHKTSGGTVLASVRYERAPGGEPTKITREDGTYVVLQYDAALRLTNEVYYNASGVPVATNGYGYDASGNRVLWNKDGTVLTNSVQPGYRITSVKNGASTVESYAYDNGGRVTTITRDSATLSLAYNSADQVAGVTNSGSWVSYQHDATGRRTVSVDSGNNVRSFLVAPTPGTDLESPQLIANGSGALQQGYVYMGDEPVLRYDANGTATYYLEDGMGSVIGIAPASSPTTGNTTRLFYDGFGNTRGTNGPAPVMPAGAGGDFRFQGGWLESFSGLYNMRAREYDARLGRFTSMDPREGDFRTPETMNPYNYAGENAYVYNDPSGEEFTITSITAADAINTSIEAFKNVAINAAKNKIKDALQQAASSLTIKALRGLFPGFDDLFNNITKNPGNILESQLKAAVCSWVPGKQITKYLWFYPGINRNGVAGSPGFNCPNLKQPRYGKGLLYPDYIIGENSPVDVSKGRASKSWLVGDIKLSGNSLYKQYVQPGNHIHQLEAIVNYANKSTELRSAVFITFFSGERANMRQVGVKIAEAGVEKGTLAFVVSFIKNKNY